MRNQRLTAFRTRWSYSRGGGLGVLVLVFCGGLVFAQDQPRIEADIWNTTGEKTSGDLVDGEAEQLTIRLGEVNQTVSSSEVWQLALTAPETRPPRPAFWLHLTNGDRWGVSSIKLAEEEIELSLSGSEELRKLSIGAISGIQPVRSGTTWRTDETEWLQIARRREKSDLVILRNGDHQSGEVSAVDDKALTLAGSAANQTVEWSAVRGLLLNPDLAEVPQLPASGWIVLLNDDSWMTVSTVRMTPEGTCQLATAHNIEWSIPLAQVRWMSHWSPAATPLSRMPIAFQKHRPLLGETNAVALDRNVRGLLLRHDPVLTRTDHTAARLPALCPWGVGLTSGMTARWELDGSYRRLLCGLCLDATACPEGHAVVKFSADQQPPQSVTVRAGDPLTLYSSLDLTGAQTLTIEVEFGENADVCDWVNLMTPVLVP